MTELIELTIALLIAIIFAGFEIAITLYATDKTTEQLMKHIDENHRKLEAKLQQIENAVEVKEILIRSEGGGTDFEYR